MTTSQITYDTTVSTVSLADQLRSARAAADRWRETSLAQRVALIREVRHALAEQADHLVATVDYPFRGSPSETLAGELLPLAEACHFLEQQARRLLRPIHVGRRSRPKWLGGVDLRVHREPLGVVLVICASNYPLFLGGVQALQALVAGNAVVIKPGTDGQRAAVAFVKLLLECGFDSDLIVCLDESVESAQAAMSEGVNHVTLTGSHATGTAVLSQLSQRPTSATMELSGHDFMIVLDTANLARVVSAIEFGLRFNHSSTCIAPRRILVHRSLNAELRQRLRARLEMDPVHQSGALDETVRRSPSWRRAACLVQQAGDHGAELLWGGIEVDEHQDVLGLQGTTVVVDAAHDSRLATSDFFAPLTAIQSFTQISEAVSQQRDAEFALGATVFGEVKQARQVAQQLDAGCVVINDMIAPTADPRVPFAGRKASGFGVTRGAEGLLEMTQLKAVVTQRSRFLPHLQPVTPQDEALLQAMLRMFHGRSLRSRAAGLKCFVQAVMSQRRHQSKPLEVR